MRNKAMNKQTNKGIQLIKVYISKGVNLLRIGIPTTAMNKPSSKRSIAI